MKLSDILKNFDQLKLIQGIERELRERKTKRKQGIWIIFLGLLYEVLVVFISIIGNVLGAEASIQQFIKEFPENLLNTELYQSAEFWVIIVLIAIGLGIITLGIWLYFSKFLLRQAEEPFKYTIWIEPFTSVTSTEGKDFVNEDHNLLHFFLYHDLQEKLVERIKRLALLDAVKVSAEDEVALNAHIQVSGYFSFREERNFLVVHITPQVRIGAVTQPEIITQPVKYQLEHITDKENTSKISPEDYSKIVERVYSRVASEIYRQIKEDLKNKVKLFPTNYMRAIAYYNEAEDFSRSNTIDAYDYAIDLYREALLFFDISYRTVFSRIGLNLPWVKWGIRFIHIWAKTQIGYAKCLIYRRQISALSGRYKNPLFEVPDNLSQVIRQLIRIQNKINLRKWNLRKMVDIGEEISPDSLFFSPTDIQNIQQLEASLRSVSPIGNDKEETASSTLQMLVIRQAAQEATKEEQKIIFQSTNKKREKILVIRNILNRLLKKKDLARIAISSSLPLPPEISNLEDSLSHSPDVAHTPLKLFYRIFNYLFSDKKTMWINRLILEQACPDAIKPLMVQHAEVEKKNRLHATMAFLSLRKDTFFRTNMILSEKHKHILFEAYIVLALAYHYLEVSKKARKLLDDAKAIAPALSERNPLYLLAAGEIEPALEKKIPYFVKATEIAPEFEMAHYLLANCYEIKFRKDDEITPERAENVINKFENVLKLNPSNIAALVSQGNLYWLIANMTDTENKFLQEAENKFLQGIEVKAIVQQTFIGELQYGLARVTAEKGELNESYEYFTEAVSADPGVAAYSTALSPQKTTTPYFEYMGRKMLNRYDTFRQKVEKMIEGPIQFREEDIFDLDGLVKDMRNIQRSMANEVYRSLEPNLQKLLEQYRNMQFLSRTVRKQLVHALNRLISDDEYNILFLKLDQQFPPQERQNITSPEAISGQALIKRIMIEKAFPEKFAVYHSTDVLFSPKRIQVVSQNTQRTVLSMVYNDYGNACFNYFLRFGYEEEGNQLDRAVEAYEKAICQQSNNKVAMYNLAHAYNFKPGRGDVEKQCKLLEEAVKIGASWHTASVSLIRMKLGSFEKRERNLHRDIAREQEKIENIQRIYSRKKSTGFDKTTFSGLEEETMHQAGTLSRSKQNEDYKGKTTGTSTNFGNNIGGSSVADLHSSRGKVQFLERRGTPDYEKAAQERSIQDAEKKIARFRKELEQIEQEKEAFIAEKVSEIIEKTKLASLLKASHSHEDGSALVKWVEYIQKDRLDESDIEALVVWAEVMAYGSNSHYHAPNICELILKKYHIGAYDINGIMKDLCLRKLSEVIDQIMKDPENSGLQESLIEKINKHPDAKTWMKKARRYVIGLQDIADNYADKYPDYFLYHRRLLFVAENDIANIYYEKNLSEEAANLFHKAEAALEGRPCQGIVYANWGNALLKANSPKEAIGCFKKALDKDPHCCEYIFGLAYAHFKSADYQQAIIHYQKAIALSPVSASYYSYLAQAYQEMNNSQEEEIVYREAVALDPENDYFLNELGNACYANKNYDDAIASYDKACRLNPDNAVYRSKLGLAYKAIKQYDKAEEAHKKAYELEINNPIYENDLGNIFFLEGKYEEAIKYYKKAMQYGTAEA